MILYFIILILLIILSAFFSASEVAFVSLNEAKIETMVRSKLPNAELIKKLKNNSRRLLITILIGNNMMSVAAASLATIIAEQLFHSAIIGITTGIMTIVMLIFADMIPKSYASNYPKNVVMFTAPYLRILQWLLFPLIILLEKFTHIFAGKQNPPQISEDELRAFAAVSIRQGAIEKRKGIMLEKLFKFSDITAKDIMTPRTDMLYMKKNSNIAEAIEIVNKYQHTRYPVCDKSPDVIIGFVHARDLLTYYEEKNTQKISIEKIIRPILSVPKQMPISELLKEFQKKQTQIAHVLDEYGGTEGIVTLEDVLEELVGEITDEHDVADNIIKRIDKNTVIVAGDEELRDINEFLNCAIPGNPLDTIAEVLLDTLKKIPRKHTEVMLGRVSCKILEVKHKRIEKVMVKKLEV